MCVVSTEIGELTPFVETVLEKELANRRVEEEMTVRRNKTEMTSSPVKAKAKKVTPMSKRPSLGGSILVRQCVPLDLVADM
jgi:hypothetical protein